MVAGAIRSLINDRVMKLECVVVLDDSLGVPILMYDSKHSDIGWRRRGLGLGLYR